MFVVEVAAFETFRVELVDPELIAHADALLRSGERALIAGDVAPGSGGINTPYRWHLRPASIVFAKQRRASADVLPSEIEEDLDRWLREVVAYAPWASRIVARER